MHDTSELKPGSYTRRLLAAIVEESGIAPNWLRSPRPCPTPPDCCPSRPSSRSGSSARHRGPMRSLPRPACTPTRLRPVVALSTFLTGAFDRTNLDVGLHGQPVVFVLDRAGITGDDEPSHHGLLDMVLLSKVPDMTVFAPSNHAEDPRGCSPMRSTTAPMDLPRSSSPRPCRPRAGWRRAVLAARRSAREAASASSVWARCSAQLRGRCSWPAGPQVTVWDPRVIKPLDSDMLADAGHRLVVAVEDGLRDGGAGSAITDALSKLARWADPRCGCWACLGLSLTGASPT
ncbi:MAG: transketolase C-terminal domain-containing protein [Microthrixaceae bacterium]